MPYDHSRVKLQPTDDEEGSDFINASFVPGFNSKREFIVTQGPLHSTRDDFWRMCWETNSRAIVMLTRCIEKGREKCDHYWPFDTDPVFYGDIQVTILNESHYPDWNINEFRMMRGDTVRTIRHFHFTTWPDFGVPEPPQTLVRWTLHCILALKTSSTCVYTWLSHGECLTSQILPQVCESIPRKSESRAATYCGSLQVESCRQLMTKK